MATTAPFSDLQTKCDAALAYLMTNGVATTADYMSGVQILEGITGATFDYPAIICFSEGSREAYHGTQVMWVSSNVQVVSPRSAVTADTVPTDDTEADRHKLRVANVEDVLWSYNANLRQGHYGALATALSSAVSNLNVIAVMPGQAQQAVDEEQWTYNRPLEILCEWVQTATT